MALVTFRVLDSAVQELAMTLHRSSREDPRHHRNYQGPRVRAQVPPEQGWEVQKHLSPRSRSVNTSTLVPLEQKDFSLTLQQQPVSQL